MPPSPALGKSDALRDVLDVDGGMGPPEGRAGELSGVPRLPPASGWKVRIERTANGYLVHRLLNYPSLVKKSSF